MNIITLPVDFLDGMVSYVGSLFGSLSPLIMLAIGLPLGFWVIGKVISMVKTKAK